MKPHSITCYSFLAAALVAAVPAAAYAIVPGQLQPDVSMQADASMAVGLPQPETQNGVTFLTGGIGDEDRDAMLKARSGYNLHITNAGKDGAYEGNTRIVIFSKSGDQLIRTNAGPLFYAKLPAGSYTVMATSNGHQILRPVTVGSRGQSNLNLQFVN